MDKDQKLYNIAIGWEKEIKLLHAVSVNMKLGISESDIKDLYYRFREAHQDKDYKEYLLKGVFNENQTRSSR